MDIEKAAVECYSSYAYATRPRAFTCRGTRRAVRSVESTWRTPGVIWFRVCTDQDEIATLAYDEDERAWIVIAPNCTEENPK
jgi:hypothetical protein